MAARRSCSNRSEPGAGRRSKGAHALGEGLGLEAEALAQAVGDTKQQGDDYNVAATGGYQWIMQRRGVPLSSTTLVPGQIYQGSLATPISTQVYTFTAALNDQFVLRVQRDTGAMISHLRLFSAGGAQICRIWGAPFTRLEPCVIEQAGTYTLLIDDYSISSTGTFTLHTQRLNSPNY